MDLSAIAPLLIEAAKQILDSVVPGAKLSADQIKGVQTGYAAGKIWLPDVVAATTNTLDDAGMEAFFDLCEDTAEEGGFPLPAFA